MKSENQIWQEFKEIDNQIILAQKTLREMDEKGFSLNMRNVVSNELRKLGAKKDLLSWILL